MSRFGLHPESFFRGVYEETPPWDIGAAQPALLELVRSFPPAGPVLDVGCGSGDLAIALAKDGYQVLGIDFVPAAIDQARTKAARLPAKVRDRLEFSVGDAFRPSLLGRWFAAVVDSGFFHLFEPEDGDRFAAELSRVLVPGGRYYLLSFALTFPVPNTPRAVSEAEIRARFTVERGWRVLECRAAEFQSRIAPVPATCACIERMASRD